VLVPINETDLMADLVARLGLPVMVVARSGLGTINHTLLTLEALGARSIAVAGVVMVGSPDDENRRAIEFYGRTRVVGELPMLESLGPETLGDWARTNLDADGHLAEYLK
jgi:malonyl-CoA O-methyltransferase